MEAIHIHKNFQIRAPRIKLPGNKAKRRGIDASPLSIDRWGRGKTTLLGNGELGGGGGGIVSRATCPLEIREPQVRHRDGSGGRPLEGGRGGVRRLVTSRTGVGLTGLVWSRMDSMGLKSCVLNCR